MLAEIATPNETITDCADEFAGMDLPQIMRAIEAEVASLFDANKFRRLAGLMRAAQRLGADVSQIAMPFADRVRAVMNGVLHPEAARLTLESRRAFVVVSKLALDVQVDVARRKAVDVLTAAGPVEMPLSAVSDSLLNRVLDPETRRLLPPDKQALPRPYAKKPKPERNHQVIIELSTAEWEALQARAKSRGTSVSRLVRLELDKTDLLTRPERG